MRPPLGFRHQMLRRCFGHHDFREVQSRHSNGLGVPAGTSILDLPGSTHFRPPECGRPILGDHNWHLIHVLTPKPRTPIHNRSGTPLGSEREQLTYRYGGFPPGDVPSRNTRGTVDRAPTKHCSQGRIKVQGVLTFFLVPSRGECSLSIGNINVSSRRF